MDLNLLITLVVAGVINAVIFATAAVGAYYLVRNKKIKKVLRKIFKI